MVSAEETLRLKRDFAEEFGAEGGNRTRLTHSSNYLMVRDFWPQFKDHQEVTVPLAFTGLRTSPLKSASVVEKCWRNASFEKCVAAFSLMTVFLVPPAFCLAYRRRTQTPGSGVRRTS